MKKIVCPLCDTLVEKDNIGCYTHKDIGVDINKCDSCNYCFVDCAYYSSEDLYKHQSKHANRFGNNHGRSRKYLKFLEKHSKNINIESVLEIGTPKDTYFLKIINEKFGDSKKLFSHDLIQNKLPEYVEFVNELKDLERSPVDVLFCIHVLEHIPPHQVKSFVEQCKAACKYYVFEVPKCENKKRVLESSTNPHYSFFTPSSLKEIFGNNVEFIETQKTISLHNIPKD